MVPASGGTRSSARRRPGAPARACRRCRGRAQTRRRRSRARRRRGSGRPPPGRAAGHRDVGGAGVPGRARERLLGDPVNDQRRRRRRGRRSRPRPRSRGGDLTLAEAVDQPGDRRRQAEVVERRRAKLAGQRGARASPGWRAPWFRRAPAPARAGPPRAPPRAATAGRSATGSPRRGGRARHPRPLLLLGRQRRRTGPPPLGLQAAHHPGKVSSIRSTSSVSPTPSIELGRREPGRREVDLLHLLDQVLERGEAAPQQDHVDGRARRARRGPRGTTTSPAISPATAPGDDRHRAEQHRVHHQDLSEESPPAHGRSLRGSEGPERGSEGDPERTSRSS